MKNIKEILTSFIDHSYSNNLKTSMYPKEYLGLNMKASFGMGVPARVPWVALTTSEIQVSKGIYPVFLFYKDKSILILAFGVSETEEYGKSWPVEISNNYTKIIDSLEGPIPRYGDSLIFKKYDIDTKKNNYFSNTELNIEVSEEQLEKDVKDIVATYTSILNNKDIPIIKEIQHGLFYLEKQLEDFLIYNWENTELGKKYNLIYENNEMVSQQYKTEIGPIDILVTDKSTDDFVVIELKKNQTSDDTVGQLSRYMGWVKENKQCHNVKGIIIAGAYDKKLNYALKVVNNIEVFIYKVDFQLAEFKA